jgi:hypothetical protein
VEVIVGDMVLDSAAGKRRDVDVTVTVDVAPGIKEAFLAYEVKHEKEPLDLITVEGLCAKLNDMPSITSRAIVSTSGFSEPAVRKAARHGVALYKLEPWTRSIKEFFGEREFDQTAAEFIVDGGQTLLVWGECHSYVRAGGGAPESFVTFDGDPLFTNKGKPHKRYKTYGEFIHALHLRSTQLLFMVPPASVHVANAFEIRSRLEDIPQWPMAHTLDTSADKVYLRFGDQLSSVDHITFSGIMRWEHFPSDSHNYIMSNVATNTPFAAAMIFGGAPSEVMWAFVMVPNSRKMNVVKIELSEKHRNAIRGLKLDIL